MDRYWEVREEHDTTWAIIYEGGHSIGSSPSRITAKILVDRHNEAIKRLEEKIEELENFIDDLQNNMDSCSDKGG